LRGLKPLLVILWLAAALYIATWWFLPHTRLGRAVASTWRESESAWAFVKTVFKFCYGYVSWFCEVFGRCLYSTSHFLVVTFPKWAANFVTDLFISERFTAFLVPFNFFIRFLVVIFVISLILGTLVGIFIRFLVFLHLRQEIVSNLAPVDREKQVALMRDLLRSMSSSGGTTSSETAQVKKKGDIIRMSLAEFEEPQSPVLSYHDLQYYLYEMTSEEEDLFAGKIKSLSRDLIRRFVRNESEIHRRQYFYDFGTMAGASADSIHKYGRTEPLQRDLEDYEGPPFFLFNILVYI
jgi:hypothetical protein